jgi:hypothetical protein
MSLSVSRHPAFFATNPLASGRTLLVVLDGLDEAALKRNKKVIL